MPTWDDNVEEIKPFETAEQEFAFPAGKYLCVLGNVRPVYPEGERGTPDAVLNDIYVTKYLGTTGEPKDEIRITFKDGKPIFVKGGTRGVKMIERYPNPAKLPALKWKAKAFFDKFEGCITVITSGLDSAGDAKNATVVDWMKVRQKMGTVFKVDIVYGKGKGGKQYRNLDYESIVVSNTQVPLEDMKKIEALYEKTYKAEKDVAAGATSTVAAPSTDVEDLPF